MDSAAHRRLTSTFERYVPVAHRTEGYHLQKNQQQQPGAAGPQNGVSRPVAGSGHAPVRAGSDFGKLLGQ